MFHVSHSPVSQKRKRGQKNQKRGGKSKRSRTGVALDREQSNGIELNGEVNEDEGAEEIVDDSVGSITIDHAIRNAVLELVKVSEATFVIYTLFFFK